MSITSIIFIIFVIFIASKLFPAVKSVLTGIKNALVKIGLLDLTKKIIKLLSLWVDKRLSKYPAESETASETAPESNQDNT